MKAVLQRVTKASVLIDGKVKSEINKGLLILLGISNNDTDSDVVWLSKKIANLRIFNDDYGIMNKSLLDEHADAIVVSQFTLLSSTKKGNRPSYINAAKSDIAIPLYKSFIQQIEFDLKKKVGVGIFGADMKINLINDGPVTIIIDTENKY